MREFITRHTAYNKNDTGWAHHLNAATSTSPSFPFPDPPHPTREGEGIRHGHAVYSRESTRSKTSSDLLDETELLVGTACGVRHTPHTPKNSQTLNTPYTTSQCRLGRAALQHISAEYRTARLVHALLPAAAVVR